MAQRLERLPIARLAGVTEYPGEIHACSLVFQLKTETGLSIQLRYADLMAALRFAQEQGVLSPLSAHWWARVERYDGCAL